MRYSVFTLVLVPFLAMAASGDGFKEAKEAYVKFLGERVTIFQKAKDCASSSTSREELKKCKDELQAAGKNLKEEVIKEKEAKKEEKIQKLKTKLDQLQNKK